MKAYKIKAAALFIGAALLVSACSPTTGTAISSNSSLATAEIIPVPSDYPVAEGGGAYENHAGDHPDSIYYQHPDFYTMKNSDTLTILPSFKTYQQTTEVTCGPASALMVLNHYGNTEFDELSIADSMKTHQDVNSTNSEEPGVADEQGEYGTSTSNMVLFFEEIGWDVSSSLTSANPDGNTFEEPTEFEDWVIENLSNNTPIMVEWVDWLGHWQVVIGYDTMGTETLTDDVLILADPYDTTDHWQDGYYIVPANRFFYMWSDHGVLPEEQQLQQWLIATPPKNS